MGKAEGPRTADPESGWRRLLPVGVRGYFERAPLAALFLGISSGFPYAMIGATLTTRLKQDGINRSTITAFALAFLIYNLKPLWSWVVDGVRLPIIGRLGQRVSWMMFVGILVIAAVAGLGIINPAASLGTAVTGTILVAFAAATFDIIIDAYRIELLEPHQLGVGSGMSQYGWRIGSAGAGAIALVIAARGGWTAAYIICAGLAVPAMITALVMGEPERHREPVEKKGIRRTLGAIWKPFAEFLKRQGALLVLLFILLHKIGDTLANLTFRLLFDDLHFTNDEIALYDAGVGFWAYLIGIFIGGVLYSRLGMKRSVLISLVLMAVSNFGFALLAVAGHNVAGMAGAIGFENAASGIGGVCVVAYFSALCDLRFTASQYALISAAASVVGRLLTGTSAGALIDALGYVNFYLLTTALALPGILIFWGMMRAGLVDSAMGTAGKTGSDSAGCAADTAAIHRGSSQSVKPV
jgi:PAT family beta-lactamase induction signal transducer AmpG